MPQFDPASFVPQLFWFGVIFTLLYFVVVRPTLPKVGRVIDARETQIAGDLDRAEAAKGAADALRESHEAAMKARVRQRRPLSPRPANRRPGPVMPS